MKLKIPILMLTVCSNFILGTVSANHDLAKDKREQNMRVDCVLSMTVSSILLCFITAPRALKSCLQVG